MNPIYEGVNGVNEQYEIEADSTEMKLSDEYIAKTKTKIIYINDKLSSSFFNDVVFSIKIEDNSQIEAIIEELTEQKNFFPSISNLYYENGKIHLITKSINNSIGLGKMFIDHIDEVSEKTIQKVIAQLLEMLSQVHLRKMNFAQLALDDIFIDVDNDDIILLNILQLKKDEGNIDVKVISKLIKEIIKMYMIYSEDKSSNPPSFRRNKSVNIVNNFSFNKSNSLSEELNELFEILSKNDLTIEDIAESQFMRNGKIMKQKTMKNKKVIGCNNDINIGELVSKFKASQLAVIDEDNSDETLLSKVISDCSKKQKKKKLICLDDKKRKQVKKAKLYSSAIVGSSQMKNKSFEESQSIIVTERKEKKTPIRITFKPLDMVLVNTGSMEMIEAAMKERKKEIPRLRVPLVNENNNIWEKIKSIFN